jgi:hypothetical protein
MTAFRPIDYKRVIPEESQGAPCLLLFASILLPAPRVLGPHHLLMTADQE